MITLFQVFLFVQIEVAGRPGNIILAIRHALAPVRHVSEAWLVRLGGRSGLTLACLQHGMTASKQRHESPPARWNHLLRDEAL